MNHEDEQDYLTNIVNKNLNKNVDFKITDLGIRFLGIGQEKVFNCYYIIDFY